MNLFECAVNGVFLSDLPYNIVLYDMTEAASESVTSTPKSISDGAVFVRKQRESLFFTLRLAIREQDTARRTAAFAAVQGWAKGGGTLTRSDRPDQELLIDHVQQPVMQSALKWTDIVDITFQAYAFPFWQGVEPVTVTLNDDGSITVPGTADTAKASAVITPDGELTAVTISTGACVVSLEDLSIPAGQALTIGYDDSGYMRIESGGESLLLNRTVDSSDELCVLCGGDTASVTANTAVTVELTARGVWL